MVLDLGCGEGRHVISAYVEANVHSVGVDLSLDDLKTTRDKFADFAEPDNDGEILRSVLGQCPAAAVCRRYLRQGYL